MADDEAHGSFDDTQATLRPAGREAVMLQLRLSSGDVRHLALGTRTGSIGNALDRLEDWIETEEGSWIHKRWIVEATVADPGP